MHYDSKNYICTHDVTCSRSDSFIKIEKVDHGISGINLEFNCIAVVMRITTAYEHVPRISTK